MGGHHLRRWPEAPAHPVHAEGLAIAMTEQVIDMFVEPKALVQNIVRARFGTVRVIIEARHY
jgi:hypothetical protein